jgi:cell division protein FtsN
MNMNHERGGLILGLMMGVLVGLALALVVALYVTKAPVPFVNKVPPRTADQDAAELERNRNWDPNAGLTGKASRPADAASGSAPTEAQRQATVIAPPGSRDPAAILAGAPVPASTPGITPPANRPAPPAPAVQSPGAAASGSVRPAQTQAPAPAPALPPVVMATPTPTTSPGGTSAKSGPETLTYFVQAGAFQGSADAEQQRAKLAILGVETKVIEREQSGRMVFRVRAGPFAKQADADAVKAKLTDAGVEALLVTVNPRQP